MGKNGNKWLPEFEIMRKIKYKFVLSILQLAICVVSEAQDVITIKNSKSLIDPYAYIATMVFDGQDWFDNGESNFPMSYRFNTTQDANSDGVINVEDNLENLILYSIGDSLQGYGRTGLTNRGSNDQRPAVYFHFVQKENYDVYEYWLYYADNNWLNDHEHDWEKYYVYVQNSVPVYVIFSTHDSFIRYGWCQLIHHNGHPYIGVDGGSHAMKTDSEDGVSISYNGNVSKNNGTLIHGDGLSNPWIIYSNDSNIISSVPYQQVPDTFYYGDPYYSTNSYEYGDPRQAPWLRYEWDNPPDAPVVNLGNDTVICSGNNFVIDAGTDFSFYQWSTGATGSGITVNNSGIYSVEATDVNGCKFRDTIKVTFDTIPVTGFSYDATTGLTVQFTNLSLRADNYLWDFDDGTVDTTSNPVHAFSQQGLYNVCLSGFNACGTDSFCEDITMISTAVGDIDDISTPKFYPNPFNDYTSINLPDFAGAAVSFQLFDNTGRLIIVRNNIKENPFVIFKNQMVKGFYYYVFSIQGRLLTKGILAID